LPEEVGNGIAETKRVKEGYLEQSKLALYTSFALIVADLNRLLSPNFKANPLFKRLRRRTKEGWNLSLWQKFVHNFSLNKKATTKEGLELQIWRWFEPRVEGDGIISIPLRGGIEINESFEKLAKLLDEETLKKYFAFRVKGSYRIGYAEEIDGERGVITLNIGGVYRTVVPFDRVVAVYRPDLDGSDWKDKDRSGLLKALRLTPKVICQYTELLREAINRLLEPYMVYLSEYTPRVSVERVPTEVVVDKPIARSEVSLYIYETARVYSNPFSDRVRLLFVNLFERSEKNKKLLRDAKGKFLEDLKGFFERNGQTLEVEEVLWDKKVKSWNLRTLGEVLEFLNTLSEKLQNSDFALILIPEMETIGERIFYLPFTEGIGRFINRFRASIITDAFLKLYLKTAKVEKRAELFLSVLREMLVQSGGAPYILSEPLPFGRVFLERDGGYLVLNLFGEVVERVSSPEPAEEDLVISFSPRSGALYFDKRFFVEAVRSDDRCENAPKGAFFGVGKGRVFAVLGEARFGHSVANSLSLPEGVADADAVKTLLSLGVLGLV
jgi:hypothetical protein